MFKMFFIASALITTPAAALISAQATTAVQNITFDPRMIIADEIQRLKKEQRGLTLAYKLALDRKGPFETMTEDAREAFLRATFQDLRDTNNRLENLQRGINFTR